MKANPPKTTFETERLSHPTVTSAHKFQGTSLQLAIFGPNPNSKGRFRAGDFYTPEMPKPGFAEFEVGATAPDQVYEIRLTKQQVDEILKPRR